ncbi:MAG TPA: serine hydrolase domain-containing protein [Vicinamibacteria bacterium]|nr:serine hydrolase domain-containing protein [Vicinamibacteria bacterium]
MAPLRLWAAWRRPLAAAVLAAACSGQPATEARRVEAPSPSPDHAALVESVDALAGDALQRGPIAGLSIAVVADGRTVLAKGYGHADREAAVAATADTSYPIASVTKQFTAAAVLRLAEQGRLSLEDPLRRFFPAARPKIGVLTLRHLLSHTSGLTRGGPAPRAAALSVLTRGGTARAQGAHWDYSNYNFSLLGLVIEQASGRSYADYVRDELAVPLGLTGTGYCEDGTALPGRARDYLSGLKTVTPTDYWTQARFFASGGLCSTVLDLVRWTKALEEGRVVRPASLQAMRSPTPLPEGVEADYGYGTRLGMTGGHRKLGHTGGGQGNKAVLARYPDDDLTVVVLLNTERPNAAATANDLEERIAEVFFGLEETSPTDIAMRQEGQPLYPDGGRQRLSRYAGRYRDRGRLVRVTVGEGTLELRTDPRRNARSALAAVGGDVFRDVEDPSVQLRFQVRGDEAKGYGRDHNGWFVGLGVRDAAP